MGAGVTAGGEEWGRRAAAPRKGGRRVRTCREGLARVYKNTVVAVGVMLGCRLLVALGVANMWLAIFADVGVMILAVLNAIRALFAGRS